MVTIRAYRTGDDKQAWTVDGERGHFCVAPAMRGGRHGRYEVLSFPQTAPFCRSWFWGELADCMDRAAMLAGGWEEEDWDDE